MELSTRHRRMLSTVLAVFLAVESVSAVAAAAVVGPVTGAQPADAPSGPVAAETPAPPVEPVAVLPVTVTTAPSIVPPVAEPVWRPAPVPSVAADTPTRTAHPAAATVHRAPVRKAKASKTATGAKKTVRTSTRGAAVKKPRSYAGRNHVWIPALGISRSVQAFSCSRTRPPDNYMYRWGCAGSNNVYLMGHAYGPMRPLHDAYVRGRLHAGLKAYYADARGRVHVYAVRWWKLTRPTTDASWAWAAQSVPSMTLQTCVGASSQYRLMVRLVEVGG